VYWSSEFILGSRDVELSTNATLMMALLTVSLPTTAELQHPFAVTLRAKQVRFVMIGVVGANY